MKKKIIKFIMYANIAVIILGAVNIFTTMTPKANNYMDTRFCYNFESDVIEITDVFTGLREKQDDSSAYVYNNNSQSYINYIRVMGAYEDGDMLYDDTYFSEYYHYQQCDIGESKYLLNLVYERGRRQCGLYFDPGNGHNVHIDLLWSPDSI